MTRSGCAAVNEIASGAPSEIPTTAARSHSLASITARRSSIRSSVDGISLTRSDRPVPRLSNKVTRANDVNAR